MRVFFDLDETLIRSYWPTDREWDGADFNFFLENGENWGVYVRPRAIELIGFAKLMAGSQNVFILTKALESYALTINVMGHLGIEPQNIFDRNFMEYALGCVRYDFQDGKNILIDDMDYFHENTQAKLKFLHAKRDNFLQIPGFQVGNEVTNQMAYFKARAFIKEKAGEKSLTH